MESVDPSPMQQLTLVNVCAAGSPLYIDTRIALCLQCSIEQQPAINLGFEKLQFNTRGSGLWEAPGTFCFTRGFWQII